MWVVVDVKLLEITSIDWPQMSNLPVMKKTKCEKFSWTNKHELTKDISRLQLHEVIVKVSNLFMR